MKTYTIIKHSKMWSTNALLKKAEETINQKSKDGYEIVSVSFGVNVWLIPTVYITLCKEY